MSEVGIEKGPIQAKELTRDYYKILQLGQTGKGKTYSFRNMNPETTGFVNVENKPLPFKNRFKYHTRCNTYMEAYNALVEYAKNPEVKTIVFDSFSAYVELLLGECRKRYKGFDVWNTYNEEIGKLLFVIKRVPKEVFITGHYEILGIEGAQEKRCKVKGKEWEGLVEKEFTIVMFSEEKFDEKGKPAYFFDLVQERSSSKCPPDIFGADTYRITNDSQQIYEKIMEFVS